MSGVSAGLALKASSAAEMAKVVLEAVGFNLAAMEVADLLITRNYRRRFHF
jgi:hypothetical protein